MILDDYFKQIPKYREEKEKQPNIFSVISDAYKRENYTSDVLSFILNPGAIGSDNYLKNFLKIINIDEISFFQNSPIKVYREEDRIDILIHNEKPNKRDAIIIESKLNNAPDQHMQLIRYYKKKEKEFNILTVVYLTINPKDPDLDYYDGYNIKKEEYDNLVNKVKAVLCNVTLKTLLNDFSPKKGLRNIDILFQFKMLLSELKGVYQMSKEIISDIFFDPKKIEDAKSFIEIWQSRESIFKQMFDEMFKEKYDKKYVEIKDDSYLFEKTAHSQIYCCPANNSKAFWVQIGFKTDDRISEKELERLITILNEIKPIEESSITTFEATWHYFEYTYDEKISFEVFFNEIKELLNSLIDKLNN